MDKKKRRFVVSGIDLVLAAVAVALFVTGALLLWWSPEWWSYYLSILDVRVWPPQKVVGVVVVVIESWLIIRYWPSRDRRRSAETSQNE